MSNIQYHMNGLSGRSADLLLDYDFDTGVLRPYRETDPRTGRFTGRNLHTLMKRYSSGNPVLGPDGKPQYEELVTNTPATLRREDWLLIDKAVAWAAKSQLRLWGDIYGTNPYTITNGMATPLIQHAVANGDADVLTSMDPIRKGERSRPTVDTAITPLPVTHSDGLFSLREISVSRNGSMPLDTTNIKLSARKVSERVENLCAGNVTFSYGGGSIYGLRNHPSRSTKSLTAPTGSNGPTVIAEILDMVKTLRDHYYYGPYVAYYSNAYYPYLGLDYATGYPKTLRQRITELDASITKWVSLDVLSGYQIIIVQITDDVIQGIQGMPMRTVQWDEQGGFEKCFKVLTMQQARVRADANGYVGINHGTG